MISTLKSRGFPDEEFEKIATFLCSSSKIPDDLMMQHPYDGSMTAMARGYAVQMGLRLGTSCGLAADFFGYRENGA
jgi:hypothetical protein